MSCMGRKPEPLTLKGVEVRIKSTYRNHAVARIGKDKYLCCSTNTCSFDYVCEHPDFLGIFNRNIPTTDLIAELGGYEVDPSDSSKSLPNSKPMVTHSSRPGGVFE